MFCSNCRSVIDPTKKFCGKCGEPVVTSPTGPQHARPAWPAARAAEPASQQVAPPYVAPAPKPPRAPMTAEQKRKLKWSGISVGILLVLFLVYSFLANRPALVHMRSNVAGATVRVDGREIDPTTLQKIEIDAANPMNWWIPVKRDHHTISVTHDFYTPWSESFDLSIFSGSHESTAFLQPMIYAVPITSTPLGAEIRVDGHSIGRTIGGLGLIAQMSAGTHTVQVTVAGLPSETQTVAVVPGTALNFDLASKQEARNRELASHLDQARSLFQEQRYGEAIAICDAILAMDPGNSQATILKQNVEQTQSILGGH